MPTRTKPTPRERLWWSIEQKASVLKGVFHKGLVHGNLNAENAVVTLGGKPAKWVGFGCAHKTLEAGSRGTKWWLEPENGGR